MTPLPPLLLLLALSLLTQPLHAQRFTPRPQSAIPSEVEALYQKGLAYLASSQSTQGHWDDPMGHEPGVVGLCLLAFLAHGEDPQQSPHRPTMEKALDYILQSQNQLTGYMGSNMYSHGFAALALAECYGMFDDPRIAPALQKSIALILSAQQQNKQSAWRYTPTSTDADTTVTGCQLVALYAARNAGLPVPAKAFEKGLRYLESCQNNQGAIGYTSKGGSRTTLTAIGSLCFSLAKQKDKRPARLALTYLQKQLDYRDRDYPYYFEYYMSQALFHADETLWENWNEKNIRYLSVLQAPSGAFPGNKGASFSTAGALLSLALNYRFLPIYER